MTDGAAQKRLYETIHAEYADHYYDREAMAFREEFIFKPLLESVDLNLLRVAEICCGAGHNTRVLAGKFPRATFTGFDIAPSACGEYRRQTGFPAHEIDLTKPLAHKPTFEAVLVIGGLHHCVSDLPQTLENVAQMLVPDGLFLMMEPNGDYFLEALRRYWYKKDKYFDAATERALDHDDLAAMARPWFAQERCVYLGGPAYFLILNSLVLRIPKSVKRAIASPCYAMERAFNRLPGKKPFPYFVAQWRREYGVN